jgi:hypothetical protein
VDWALQNNRDFLLSDQGRLFANRRNNDRIVATVQTFHSFNQLADFCCGTGNAVFNANPPIYDHVTDDAVGDVGSRRMSDDAIETTVKELDRIWQQFGISPSEITRRRENNQPKINRLVAEQKFRGLLNDNVKLKNAIQKGGLMAILFEQPVIDLLPCDPEIAQQWMKPSTPDKTKNSSEILE